jgi:hypothetical protein
MRRTKDGDSVGDEGVDKRVLDELKERKVNSGQL